MLHKYANEDVSLGSWFIGLDVEHIDDRRLCCGTPPGIPTKPLFLFSLSGLQLLNNMHIHSSVYGIYAVIHIACYQ